MMLKDKKSSQREESMREKSRKKALEKHRSNQTSRKAQNN